MTGKTHDLAAFTGLTIVFILLPLQPMSVATAITAFSANFIGGLFPDIDQPTSDLWDNFRGGKFAGRFFTKLLGGHRHISHSLVGFFLTGWLLEKFLLLISGIFLVDMNIVWWCFMIGVFTHLITDSVTKDGIPLLWPIQWRIGVPPLSALRIRSGKFVENKIIFPGLLLFSGYLLWLHQSKVLDFFNNYLGK